MVSAMIQYLAPSLGVIFACLMNAAPTQSLKGALAAGSLGSLNSSPWAFMFGNCLGWTAYSYITNDLFVFFANSPGLMLSLWLNTSAIKLQYNSVFAPTLGMEDDDEKMNAVQDSTTSTTSSNKETSAMLQSTTATTTTTPMTPQERLLYVIALVWLLIISFVSLSPSLPHGQKVSIIGVCSNINLIFFFGAPLSSIAVVLRLGSSAPIHRKTLVLNSLCAAFWSIYGLSIHDLFIAAPNIIGLSLSSFQVLLCVVYPANLVPYEQSIQLSVVRERTTEPREVNPDDHQDHQKDSLMTFSKRD